MSTNTIVTETRQVSGFDEVEVNHFGDLTIIQGEPEGITIEADANLLPKIVTQVKHGKLVIELGRDWWERLLTGILSIGKGAKYTVTMKEIRGVETNGASKIFASSINTDKLDVESSGTSTVQIGNLQAEELEISISGRGVYEIAGAVIEQKIEISGSGEVKTPNLACEEAEVKISGHGHAILRVSKQLDIRVSGMGTVEYYGSPRVSQSISGMGSVKRLEETAPSSAEVATTQPPQPPSAPQL